MHIQPFQAVYPKVEYITSADSFFQSVREEYQEYVKSGFFTKASQEGIYIYEISTLERSYLGFIASTPIEEYLNGNIKKHENTIADKEQQQMRLLLKRNAQVKPVLLTYHGNDKINSFLKNYTEKNEHFLDFHFEASQESHKFWQITDGKMIRKLQDFFETKVSAAYVADGHHRTSTAALMDGIHSKKNNYSYQQLLTAYFPAESLDILEFNRIVDINIDQSYIQLIVKLAKIFDIDPLSGPSKPRKKHEIVMQLKNEWFLLQFKDIILEKHRLDRVILDVQLLNDYVLRDIFEIYDVRTDPRLKYLEGFKGLEKLVEKSVKADNRISFCMFPLDKKDFFAISDANEVLPPKSTCFYPRIKNGLIVKQFYRSIK